MRKILFVLVLVATSVCLVGCGKTKYKVEFYFREFVRDDALMSSKPELYHTVKVKSGERINSEDIKKKFTNGFLHEGFFYDILCEVPIKNIYELEIKSNLKIYAKLRKI